jgi:hypothetical protein
MTHGKKYPSRINYGNKNHGPGHTIKAAAHNTSTKVEDKSHAEHTEHLNKSSEK